MKKLKFINKKNQVEHSIDISKKNTYIYGGNGVGKTTLSRVAKTELKESFVFNVDFINKNLFIVDKDGIKDDSSTKDGLTRILIDEKEIELKKKLIKLEENLKENKEKMGQVKNKLTQVFNENNCLQNSDLLYLDISSNYNFNYNYEKKYDDNMLGLEITQYLKTDIKNDEQLKAAIISINEKENIQKTLIFIKENEILNDIVNVDISINKIIEEKTSLYLENLNRMRDAENCFSKSEYIEEYKKWISDGLNLHENIDDCLFCENENISKKKEIWKENLSSDILEVKKYLIVISKEIISNCNEFIKSEIYTQYLPLIKESLEKIRNYFLDFKNKILKNEIVQYSYMEIKKDSFLESDQSQLNEVKNYILNKNLKEYYGPIIIQEKLDSLKKNWERELDQEYEIYNEDLQTKLNSILITFGYDREMQIVTDKKSSQRKISLKISDSSKLNTLSEGQKHKLALAIFFLKVTEFYSLQNQLKYLILDDPVSTLDISTQHSIRDFLFNKLGDYYENIIILTHNFNYLMLMISNLHENKDERDQTTLLYLHPNECIKLNLNNISHDDLLLFIKSFKEIKDLNDLSIWRWIILKIYRTLLNIKTSLIALNSHKDPNCDIQIIFSEDEINKNRALEINSSINNWSYKKVVKVEIVKKNLEELIEFSNLLNLPIKLSEDEIEKVFSEFNMKDNTLTFEKMIPKDFDFTILYEGYKIIFEAKKTNKIQLKNYILHPKNQITSSLTSLYTQRDY
ncbi:hypothetical protein [Spiroplasma endosymbiont of Cantharis nigra]|uniref:hypothetical protein n=1 Tax=Spiroplasma endosymbiont of Cantharis nigra TaxID=3066278 RepID=UPI0030D200A7